MKGTAGFLTQGNQMVKVQYQVQLFCGGGNLLFLLETKSSHLTPYPSPDVLLDLGDSNGWTTLLWSLKRHIFFILDEISPEISLHFQLLVIFLVQCGYWNKDNLISSMICHSMGLWTVNGQPRTKSYWVEDSNIYSKIQQHYSLLVIKNYSKLQLKPHPTVEEASFNFIQLLCLEVARKWQGFVFFHEDSISHFHSVPDLYLCHSFFFFFLVLNCLSLTPE